MKNTILIFLSLIFLTACDNDHFLTDRSYRKKVKSQFEATKELAKNRKEQLFSVFDQDLSLRDKEALEFLYAYMSLSDLADYNGEFFLQNIRSSFAARDTFAWGKTVPEDMFRHFVLPVRVNNENLDSSRMVFFEELKDRIKNLSMKDAALEINHWCHEKVTYKGSDSRTSSPLATVKTAYGRCGEESTFTVAAMRSACIPARQCYTPRWAHVDDNHAWVEVWIDGKWHYLGACEPESDLDMGWFSGPSKRTMLVSTNVFGDYSGPEDVLLKDERFTRINVLPNYTETKRIFVHVTDEAGKSADSAGVEFQLYNYAEFYPLVKCYTGNDGLCSFQTGLGDLVVWAAKGEKFGYKKITVAETDTLELALTMKPGSEYSESFDMVPPPVINTEVKIPDSVKEANARRFAFEDQVRGNYEKTFIDSSKAYRVAATAGMNGDTVWDILKRSRGNYREVIDFMTNVPDNLKNLVFPILYVISEKDLHDIDPAVLFDQVNASGRRTTVFNGTEMYYRYILNPRIANEYLRPYQTFLQSSFDDSFINEAQKDPVKIKEWISKNILIDRKNNYSRAPITPVGVFELKTADPVSRDIFFVAVCRSFGIPARVETSNAMPQYFLNGKWNDVIFEKSEKGTERGILILQQDPSEKEIKPEYYIHYTVERFIDGYYRSLDYENNPDVSTLPCRLEVIPGSYLVVTGNRLENGTVLANLSFINIESAREKKMTLSFRKESEKSEKEIKIDMGEFMKNVIPSEKNNLKGDVVVAWLEPEKEPSRHFISDIILKKKDFEDWSGDIIFLFNSERERKLFLEKNQKEVPSKIRTYLAGDNAMKYLSGVTKMNLNELPVIILADKNGYLKFIHSGYRIGTGDDLLRITKK